MFVVYILHIIALGNKLVSDKKKRTLAQLQTATSTTSLFRLSRNNAYIYLKLSIRAWVQREVGFYAYRNINENTLYTRYTLVLTNRALTQSLCTLYNGAKR